MSAFNRSVVPVRSAWAACTLLVVTLLATPAITQQAPPSPEEHLGYGIGDHFTDHSGVRGYARALADASPYVEYRAYGTTPQRRELFQLVITSADNHRRLDAILRENEALTDPETPRARAEGIAATNPAVVYLTYGLHGNESSSSEAAMVMAWDLARGATGMEGVLDSLVIVMDPVANPDGRDRYVHWFNSVVGARANPSIQAREHHEPWPGGRFNHYLFDLNRDWAWGSQPETRSRLATWWRWNPQLHVDFHEMNYNTSYFFFPAADPINPAYPDFVLEWASLFGEANARAFDARGWPYYTGEAFDLFYPGYGDSWPSLVGAVGMTYEQAGHGMAGRAVEREAGDTLTLADRVEGHHTTGRATLVTAASNKTRLLREYAASQRAIGQGEDDFFLVPHPDLPRADSLAAHLREQGIEVERATRPFRARATAYDGHVERREFPEGTYRVRARQARGRLAVTVLQRHTELLAEYSYDISAWSLPYAYGVEAHRGDGNVRGAGWVGVDSGRARAQEPRPASEPGYGYLIPPGEDTAGGIVSLLNEGVQIRVLSRPATFRGQRFRAGTWFAPAHRNPELREQVARVGLGAWAVPVASGMSEEGMDLGSSGVRPVRLPAVAVLAGEGIQATSFGPVWYYLEQHLGMPFDAIDLRTFGRMDLGRYDVIILPEAGSAAFTDEVRDGLTGWVGRGGRLVAFGGAAEHLAEAFEVPVRGEVVDDGQPEIGTHLLGREERERRAWLERVPGTILPVRMDPAHPVTWGADRAGEIDGLDVLHVGSLAFEPAEGVETFAYFPPGLAPRSGVISEANLERLERSGWGVTRRVGSGSVVMFAGDPLFRMFWRTTRPMFVNAVLLGP